MGVPKWAIDAPSLPLGSEIVFDSYVDLDTCRTYGFGSGPIPWTSIVDYAVANGLPDDEIADFVTLIRMMDGEHLRYNQRKAEEK